MNRSLIRSSVEPESKLVVVDVGTTETRFGQAIWSPGVRPNVRKAVPGKVRTYEDEWEMAMSESKGWDLDAGLMCIVEPKGASQVDMAFLHEVAFETLGVPAFGRAPSTSCALISANEGYECTVVDFGARHTTICGAEHGFGKWAAGSTVRWGGLDLTDMLATMLLTEAGMQGLPHRVVEDLKVKYMYAGPGRVRGAAEVIQVYRPDGSSAGGVTRDIIAQVGQIVWNPPTGLVLPRGGLCELIRNEGGGESGKLEKLLMIGGGAKLAGMKEVLETELNVDVVMPSEPEHAAWRGGALLGSLTGWQGYMKSRAWWNEWGH